MEIASRLTRETIGVGVPQRDMIKDINAAYTAKPWDRLIHGTVNTANDSYTLTLPPVSEMAGAIVSIWATVANSKVLTVAHAGDSLQWTDLTMDTDNDHSLLYSDGLRWHVIKNGIV
jgi:hypothetical protein